MTGYLTDETKLSELRYSEADTDELFAPNGWDSVDWAQQFCQLKVF